MALTQIEKDSIRTFVKEQYLNGNWQKVDSFCHFGLSDPADALHDWKRGTPLVNNGTTHVPKEGREFNGIDQWIDSMYNPSNDAINVEEHNANVGNYVAKHENTNSIVNLFSASSIKLKFNFQTKKFTHSIHAEEKTTGVTFKSNTFYSTDKDSPSIQHIRKNGRIVASSSITTFQAPPNSTLQIGRDEGGTNYFKGILSSFLVGASVYFLHEEFSKALKILNSTLKEA